VPHEAGAEVRAEGRRPRAVQEARGKVIAGGATTTSSPPPATAAADRAPRIVVTIASKGEIFVGATLVDEAALPGKLRDLARRDPSAQLVLRPDKAVPHGRIVRVIEIAKQAGLTRIAISTAP
jgi:biopolymer transport protein ExbD